MNIPFAIVAVLLSIGVVAWLRTRQFDAFFLAAIGAVLLGLAGWVFAMVLWGILPRHFEWRSIPLVGAHSAQQTSGSFFLGSGRIGSETHWVFWYRTGGAIARFDTTAWNVVVFEDATPETAHLDIGTEVSDAPDWTRNPDGRANSDLYQFHVPPGSVDSSFSFSQ